MCALSDDRSHRGEQDCGACKHKKADRSEESNLCRSDKRPY